MKRLVAQCLPSPGILPNHPSFTDHRPKKYTLVDSNQEWFKVVRKEDLAGKEDLAEDHSGLSLDPWVGQMPIGGIPLSHVCLRSDGWDSLVPCVGYDPCVGI